MKRFEIRLDRELHEKLREESFITEKSMHEIVIELIEDHYNKKERLGMLNKIRFISERLDFDLESSYGRKLLHESVDRFYGTFLTTDTDDEDNIIRYYLSTDITGLQTELRNELMKYNIRDFIFEYDDINIEEYEKELNELHNLITDKNIDGLLSFDSKFYTNLFTNGRAN